MINPNLLYVSKPMIYHSRQGEAAEILLSFVDDGIKGIIVSYGSHPCCYIAAKGENRKKLEKLYEKFDESLLDCHGEVTFGARGYKGIGLSNHYFVIGWDYAHSGDFLSYSSFEGKKHTTEELLVHLIKGIKQIKKKLVICG